MDNAWLHWWTGALPHLQHGAFLRLIVAMALGALVGAERQWKQRAAGMRTNTLVCFGAAAFVDLGSTVGGANSTGVIAYVVSGVGFLGAGAIMKEGASIRGLNTAATLWCSAAVGACAGAGELTEAVSVAFGLVGINLLLRPMSRYIDRQSIARRLRRDGPAVYHLAAVCDEGHEEKLRTNMLRAIAEKPLILRQIRTEDIGDGEQVSVQAEVEASSRESTMMDEIAGALRSDPDVTAVELAEGALEGD